MHAKNFAVSVVSAKMAVQDGVPSSLRSFIINEIQLGRQIGQGANSKIEEAKFEGLPVVIKQINVKQIDEQETEALRSRFLVECDRSSRLRHPNVVRFFGVYFPAEARIPSWVMELLHCDLYDLLERNQIIPLEIKMSILHQIGLGLRYLHSQAPAIVHCDLNSRNVLVSKGLEVKITDMCAARLLSDHSHHKNSKTFGTEDFMPPEVLAKNLSITKYGTELDVFSFGCVMLHTFSQQWPTPSQIITNPDEIPKSEVDRRAQYLDKVPKTVEDIVIPLIKSCLENIPFDRPTTEEVCDQLETLVVNRENTLPDNLLQAQLMLQDSQRQVKSLTDKLQHKDDEVEALKSDLSKLQTNSSPYPPNKNKVNKSTTDFWSSLKSKWEQCTDLPAQCWAISVTKLDGKVYIATGKATCPLKYDYNNDHWTILPNLQFIMFNLVAVPSRKQVLAIGGVKVDDTTATNELSDIVFLWDEANEKWLDDVYPNMPTARSRMSTIFHGSTVIVAGGISCREPFTMTRTVEVLHINDSCHSDSYWSVVDQLPYATFEAVPLIVNDNLYICVGSDDLSTCYASRNIVTAPLKELIESSNSSSTGTGQVWSKLPDMPYPSDSITHYQGRLITFCGVDLVENPDEDKPVWKLVPLIHVYNPDTKSWDCVGNFPPGYYLGISVHIKEDKILFIGGLTGTYSIGETQDLMTTCSLVTFTAQ